MAHHDVILCDAPSDAHTTLRVRCTVTWRAPGTRPDLARTAPMHSPLAIFLFVAHVAGILVMQQNMPTPQHVCSSTNQNGSAYRLQLLGSAEGCYLRTSAQR